MLARFVADLSPEDERLLTELLDRGPCRRRRRGRDRGDGAAARRQRPARRVGAPGSGRRLPPATAVRLLTAAMLVTALATGFVLAVAGLLVLAQIPLVAAVGHWSARALGSGMPVPVGRGGLAAVTVCALLAAACAGRRSPGATWCGPRVACRRLGPRRRRAGGGRRRGARRLRAARIGGRVVVSTAMLRALPADERRVLLAHEAAHLAHRHHLWVQAAELGGRGQPAAAPGGPGGARGGGAVGRRGRRRRGGRPGARRAGPGPGRSGPRGGRAARGARRRSRSPAPTPRWPTAPGRCWPGRRRGGGCWPGPWPALMLATGSPCWSRAWRPRPGSRPRRAPTRCRHASSRDHGRSARAGVPAPSRHERASAPAARRPTATRAGTERVVQPAGERAAGERRGALDGREEPVAVARRAAGTSSATRALTVESCTPAAAPQSSDAGTATAAAVGERQRRHGRHQDRQHAAARGRPTGRRASRSPARRPPRRPSPRRRRPARRRRGRACVADQVVGDDAEGDQAGGGEAGRDGEQPERARQLAAGAPAGDVARRRRRRRRACVAEVGSPGAAARPDQQEPIAAAPGTASTRHRRPQRAGQRDDRRRRAAGRRRRRPGPAPCARRSRGRSPTGAGGVREQRRLGRAADRLAGALGEDEHGSRRASPARAEERGEGQQRARRPRSGRSRAIVMRPVAAGAVGPRAGRRSRSTRARASPAPVTRPTSRAEAPSEASSGPVIERAPS